MNCKYCGNGISYKEYLQTPHWQEKRETVLRHADYRCQLCNENDRLHIHHRTYENLWNEPLSDLVALCEDCHAKFHNKTESAENEDSRIKITFKRNNKNGFKDQIILLWNGCHAEYNKGSGYYKDSDIDRIVENYKDSVYALNLLRDAMVETYSKRRSNYWKTFMDLISGAL